VLRLPGGTPLGELLRGPLKDASFELSEFEKTLLFVAVDEAGHREAERRAERGEWVIMDRCALSNWVYRMAEGEKEGVRIVEDLVLNKGRGWPKGAWLFLLTAPDEVLDKRVSAKRGVALDRFDGLGVKVRDVYSRLFVRFLGVEMVSTDLVNVADLAQKLVQKTLEKRAMFLGGEVA
jgi:thymidylate kinase